MNPIQPITTRPREISVVEPVSPALERVKRVLFRPFDLGKWFVIGFCAWLAGLGQGGGARGNFNAGSWNQDGNVRHGFDHARDYVLANLHWIVPLAAAIMILCLALWVLFTWLSSRGRFMFLHCVALDKAEVVEPWHKFAREGNSLFWFRIVLGLIGMVATLPLVVLAAIIGFSLFARGGFLVAGIMGLIGLVLALVAVAIVFGLIGKFTKDFVVPIMFLRGSRCPEAWRELLGLLKAHVGHFILYLLFQIVLGMAIGIMVLAVMIATCCCCCLMFIPYLSTVILLPVLVFRRSYSLYYLAQFGRDYDVFPPATPPQ
jgi:hypothetical protein